MSDDLKFMELALELASKGRGFTSPNPMVGAVCVKNGDIIGRGWHKKYGGPHAEVHALNDAGEDAVGSTLYVTLEPCNHTGKTPPCTKKILDSGVKKVVVAMEDPNPIVNGGGNSFLRSKGVEVVTGVLEERAKALNLPFIKSMICKKPYTVLKLAMTLDGKIATKTGDSKWITNEISRHWVHELRHQSDAILVGRKTVEADNPSLTTRLEKDNGSNPARVILDSSLSLYDKKDLNIFSGESRTIIACKKGCDENKVLLLKDKNIEVLEVESEENGMLDFDDLLSGLGKMKISSLMIEGGSMVAGSFLNKGLVDQVAFFYGPKILACKESRNAISGSGPDKMENALMIRHPKTRLFKDDILIESRTDSGWDYDKELIWPVLY